MKFLIQPLFFALGLMLFSFQATGQKSKKKKGESATFEKPKEEKEDTRKKWDEISKKCTVTEGLFTLLRDTVSGKVYFQLSTSQLDRDFIYFSQVDNGLAELGLQKGAYRGSKIVRFKRNFDRVEVLQMNTSFFYDPENALSRSAGANINNPVLAGLKIEAEDRKADKILVDGSALFISEDFAQIRRPSSGEGSTRSGSLSKEKSTISSINNYPENTEITVRFVYESGTPNLRGDNIADGRNISVDYRHCLLNLPTDGYITRPDDPRIGFFSTNVNDMTTFSPVNFRDVIHRWRLEKKDPLSEVSEPIMPITWWIENTTPVEFRPIVKEAVEKWNLAFERIGFKNAIVCNIQPDDATWDAGDIRYNVIRWTASPNPPFGGYGPSFVNPASGEILGADIMIELTSITNRVLREQMFRTTSSEVGYGCEAGNAMNQAMHLAGATMRTFNFKNISEREFVHQFLHRLILHEVGHTLGLQHNMRASSVHAPEKLNDPEFVMKYNLTNSVMEYPAIHFGLSETDNPVFFDGSPCAYDFWAIDYGYSTSHPDAMVEKLRLKKILERSHDPLLVFGNDADDMRGNTGIDPDINIYDLSNDPVAYATARCDLIKQLLPSLKENYTHTGSSYHELRNAFQVLVNEYSNQIRIISKTIGGVHINRAFPGQPDQGVPYTPVAETEQRAAMHALTKYAFAPDAFAYDNELLRHLMIQRRGFDLGGDTEDFKLHAALDGIRAPALDHFFNPLLSARILDSELYGNGYTLDMVMLDLTESIFKQDLKSEVLTHRKNLQAEYVKRLAATFSEKSEQPEVMKGLATYQLQKISTMLKGNPGTDEATKAHRQYLLKLIEKALDS